MKNRLEIAPFLAAFLIFLYLDPYFMWGLHNTTPMYNFLGVALLLLFASNTDIQSKGRKILFFLFALLLMFSSLYDDLNIFGFIGILCYLFTPFSKMIFAKKTFNHFLSIYSIVIGISGIVWILSLFGVLPPIGVIKPLNELKIFNYYVYPMLVRPDVFVLLERFCGPFDEPGVVGTISALVLTIGKFNLRNIRLLIVFVVSLFTFSLFYYIVCAVYFLVYIIFVNKDKRYGILILVVLSVLVVILLCDETISEVFLSRFLWDEDTGSLAGDNRFTDDSTQLLKKMSGTSLLFGLGNPDEILKASGGEISLLLTIAQYGIIFVFIYCCIFALYGWRYKSNIVTYLLFLFVFMACLYQRPILFQPEFLFLYSMIAMTCGDLLENKKNMIKSK